MHYWRGENERIQVGKRKAEKMTTHHFQLSLATFYFFIEMGSKKYQHLDAWLDYLIKHVMLVISRLLASYFLYFKMTEFYYFYQLLV